MGFLSSSNRASFGWVCGIAFVGLAAGEASAAFLPMVESLSLTTNESAAVNATYNLGLSVDASLGSSDNPSNKSGDAHFTYSRQLSPSDPTVDNSPLKHVNNYTGGVLVNPFEKASVGLDLDSASDRFELLFTDGVKVTVGYEPLKLSYRYAKSTIYAPFQIVTGTTPKKIPILTTFPGAFIYQHTLGLEGDIEVTEDDSLTLSIEGSTFTPGAAQFGAVIQSQFSGGGLSNFSDTLQSFETYAYSGEYKHAFNDYWDSKLELRLAHEVTTSDTLLDLNLAAGYKVFEKLHVQAGWEYTHDRSQISNAVTFELRFDWDRGGKGEKEAKKGTFKGQPRVDDSEDDE